MLAIILVALLSCNNKPEGLTVGFLMADLNSARWELDKKYFEEKVKELGGNVITKVSGGNEVNQYAQAMELINEGVDIIVIVPVNVNSAAAIVRDAHKKNIKVIAYARLIRNSKLDYFIGFDAYQIGQLQAQHVLSKKPNGNFILLEGDKADINAVYLQNGQMAELKSKIENGDINILYEVFVQGWSPIEATHEIEKVIKLSNKRIDAILAANDGTAGGAIKALKKFNLIDKETIITGADAELLACQRVYSGEQDITVYMPIKKLAETAATLAIEIIQNQSLSHSFTPKNNGRIDVPTIILQSVTIDKNNLNIVVEEGLYTIEAIESPN